MRLKEISFDALAYFHLNTERQTESVQLDEKITLMGKLLGKELKKTSDESSRKKIYSHLQTELNKDFSTRKGRELFFTPSQAIEEEYSQAVLTAFKRSIEESSALVFNTDEPNEFHLANIHKAFDDRHMNLVFEAIQNTENPIRLNFNGYHLDKKHFATLCKFVSNGSIDTLDLTNCSIEDESIAELLKSCIHGEAKLRQLILKGLKVSDQSMPAIKEWIKSKNPQLLDVENTLITIGELNELKRWVKELAIFLYIKP